MAGVGRHKSRNGLMDRAAQIRLGPTSGAAHVHAPVYCRGTSQNFATEAQAREACKRAIKRHFGKRKPADIDVL